MTPLALLEPAAAADAPAWLELARAGLVGLAGVVLGVAALVVRKYGQKAYRTGAALPTHVALVATSYCLLVIVTGGTQLELLIEQQPFSWRLPVVLLAYLLGLWSLRLVLLVVGQREETPRRRASDP